MNSYATNIRGFTLVEMIVSLALFSIVITISVGALLVLIGTNEQLQGEQTVMTNLSFALDSMTREIRTGTEYFCFRTQNQNGPNNFVNLSNNIDNAEVGETEDCQGGNGNGNAQFRFHGLVFKEGGDSITEDDDRILYYFEKEDNSATATGTIYRRVGAGAPQSIISDGIGIRNLEFFVTGSEPLQGTNNRFQPTVTILIEAVDPTDPESKVYRLQTTVTQRTFDL